MMVKICGITNREDALAAVEAGASAIGFNFYRESSRFISHTGAATIAEKIPAGAVKVAESGIHSAKDIQRLTAAGYDAFLVGEHLMKSGDPANALRALLS